MSGPLQMNADIRAKWTAALRSGEYQQGLTALRQYADVNGRLTEQQEYCCLGVLCDLAEKEGVTSGTYDAEHNWWSYDGRNDYLPESVREWAGLDTPSPEVPLPHETTLVMLAELNDDDRWSFAQIADAIDGTRTAVTS
jgi:hypothetical protein